MTHRLSTSRRIARFIAVGTVAALVHWSIAVALVRAAVAAPLLANVAGWLCALMVSFAGQFAFTFADQRAPRARAARRFFVVSAISFAVNEATYAMLLEYSGARYDVLLAAVLLLVAITTYLISRRWAFAGNPPAV
jgi:putative flippase GtrA